MADRHPHCTDSPRYCPTCDVLHAYDEKVLIPSHKLYLELRAEVERLRAVVRASGDTFDCLEQWYRGDSMDDLDVAGVLMNHDDARSRVTLPEDDDG